MTYRNGAVIRTRKYYAFGAQTVAMRDNGALYFLHGDNLGSASLTTNASSGGVVSQNRYYPFGASRFSTGTRPTALDFTGQRLDGTGLHFYNARYYDSLLGRFISADTVVAEPGNSQSWNRYSYVHNNPIRYTDPTGHCVFGLDTVVCFYAAAVISGIIVGTLVHGTDDLMPWDPPMTITDRVAEPITSDNLTPWLLNQMVTNAQSDVVSSIRANLTSRNPINQDGAMQAWAALVGTGAIWDFKVDLKKAGLVDVTLGNRQLHYDAVANMHFGFVGRAAGFGGDFLVQAAGLAQAQRALKTGNPNDWGPCNTTYYCDQPYATWSIRFGSYLYDLYKDRLDELDEAAFADALKRYIAEYGEPPEPPLEEK